MNVTRLSSLTLKYAAVTLLALAAAACAVDAGGQVPCVDDSSCPSDYPVCQSGKCVAGTGTPTNDDSVQIISVNGAATPNSAPLRGTVHIQVSARAPSGVGPASGAALTASGVSLSVGTVFAQPTASPTDNPPVYDFDLDTTQISDGTAVTLTAMVKAGDGTSATGTTTITIDNTAPTLTSSGSIPTSKTGSLVQLTVIASEPLAASSLQAVVTSGTTVVGAATVSPPATGLDYIISFGVTEALATGTYTLTMNATDIAGNPAIPLVVTFSVQAPVPLSGTNLTIGTAANVVEGGLVAGARGTAFDIALTLPNGLTPEQGGVTISVLLAGAATPTALSVSGTAPTFSATYTVGLSDPQGIATVEASVTDVAGNVSTTNGQFFIDLTVPSLAGVSISPQYVLQGEDVVMTGTAEKAVEAATVSTNNGDVGTCTCDGTVCGTSFSAAPAISCNILVSHSTGTVVATIELTDQLGNHSPTSGTDAFLYQDTYNIVLPAEATSLTAAHSFITNGTSTTLTPVFADGQGTITANVGLSPGPVSAGVAVSVAPTQTTNYTLEVTGPAGTPASTGTTVTVVDAPLASIVSDVPNVTAGNPIHLTLDFSGQADAAHVAVTKSPGSPFTGSFTNGEVLTDSPTTTTTYTLTVTNAAGAQATSTVTVFVGAAPTIGSFVISSVSNTPVAGSPTVLTITSGASVQLLPLFSNGTGTITRSDNSSSVVATNNSSYNSQAISAATPSTITFTLTVTNAAGASASSSIVVNVVPAPTCTSFTNSGPVTSGSAATLTAAFSGGTAIVDQGVGAVASGTPSSTGALSASTVYTLTVSNAASPSATCTEQTTVSVVAAPTISSLVSTANVVTTGSTIKLTPSFANGTGVITDNLDSNTISAINETQTGSITVNETETFTLTVTNGASSPVSTSASITITAVPAPTCTSLGNNGPVTAGSAALLTPVFANGTAVIDQGIGAVSSSTAVSTGALTGNVTYTMTVSNAATSPSTCTKQTTVAVVAAPTATSLAATATTVTVGSTIKLTPSFSNGTGSITDNVDSNTISASNGVQTAAITINSTETFTLTVSNSASTPAVAVTTLTITAVPAPTCTSFTNNGPITAGTSALLTPTFSNGTGAIDQGVGSVSSASMVSTGSLSANKTFTLTVTNAANSTCTKTSAVSVLAVPTIASLTSSTATTVTTGATLTLTGNFTTDAGGTAKITDSIDETSIPVTNGVATSSITINSTETFTLTVTNGASTPAVAVTTLTITAVAAPTCTSFTNNGPITAGTSALLTPTFSNGTGAIDQGVGPVSSASMVSTGSLSANKTFTLTVTNAANSTCTKTSAVSVLAAPTIASLSASPAATTVTTGATLTLTGNFTTDAGGTAKITDNIDGNSISVSNGVATSSITINSTETFTLTVTNGASTPAVAVATLTITAVAAPTCTSFTNNGPITAGTNALLTPTFSNGTGAIDQGVGPVSSASMVSTGSLSANKTFTLTVTNAANSTCTKTSAVSVLAAPTIASLSASPAATTVTTGATLTLTGNFTTDAGGTAKITDNIDGNSISVSNGVATSSITINSTETFTLTVTNGASTPAVAVATLTITAVAAPTCTSFTNNGPITSGASALITPTFSNGTGSVDQTIGAVGSGNAVSTGSLTASKTYTLTVTNAANSTCTKQTTVTVVAAPVIGSFSATYPVIGSGATAVNDLNFTFSGTGSIAASVGSSPGSVTSGTPVAVSPTQTTTYTLTASNTAGSSSQQSLTVTVISSSFAAAASAPPALSPATFGPATATLFNGQLFIFGGATALHGSTGQSAVLSVDPSASSLSYTTDAQSLANARIATTALLTNTGNVLIVGGTSAASTDGETFDPITNAFATVAAAPQINRTAPVLIQTDGNKVLVACGNASNGTAVDFFDPTAASGAGAFSSAPTSPDAHLLPCTASRISDPSQTNSLDGKIVLIGGGNVPFDIFDPVGLTWLLTGTLGFTPPTYQIVNQTATVLGNGKILIVGGSTDGTNAHVTAAAKLWDPTAPTVLSNANAGGATPGTIPGAARQYHTATLIAGTTRVLIAGGVNSSGTLLSDAFFYDWSNDTFIPLNSMTNARAQHFANQFSDGRVLIGGGLTGTSATSELFTP